MGQNVRRSGHDGCVRIALVHNPASGRGSAAAELTEALRAAGATDVTTRAIGALDEGPPAPGTDRVVVAGGDGSIAPAAVWAADAGLPFAVIPSGTANDFARALELPGDRGEAARLATDPEADVRPLELGRVHGRPFVNAANAGLAVHAARRAKPLKQKLGPLAYAVGALGAGAREHPIDVTVRADGAERFHGGAWQVIVAATGAFGGGSSIGPATPDDGVLDVTVITAGPRPGLVRRAFGLRRGTLHEQDGVVRVTGHDIEVVLPAGEEWNVDGELCDDVTRPDGMTPFTVEHHAIEIVVPR
jgi:diacylglycerol kinase family enzyme